MNYLLHNALTADISYVLLFDVLPKLLVTNRRPSRKYVIIVVLFPALLFTNGDLGGLQELELLVTQCTNRRYKLYVLVRSITKVISLLTVGYQENT